MTNHVKPSKEELQANIDAAQKALDTPPETPPPVTPPASPATPPVETPPIETETPPETPPGEETPPATPPAETGIDYKKKFTESSREAQVQGFKNKEINAAVEQAATLADPTEDELKSAYKEWEDMTPTEQMLAKDNLVNKRKFELIHQATEKFKKADEWNEKVDTYVGDPKTLIAHPELEGKTEEFKQFSSKPTRRGLDFEDLVLAFQGEQARLKPAPKKGGMFPTGSGGPNDAPKPKDDTLSPEEGRLLMKSDYKMYKQKLLAGKIRTE